MKTQVVRVFASGGALLGLILSVGCKEPEAKAQELNADAVPVYLAAEEPIPVVAQAAKATNAVEDAPATTLTNAPVLSSNTNVPVKMVQPATAPPDLKISPALTEVVRLTEAGVSEDVILAYITNSMEVFQLSSEEIVYLHDLGIPTTVITALIQHDSAPEIAARKYADQAVKPLPPGVALTSPATNVYPKTPIQAAPPAESNVPDGENQQVDTSQYAQQQEPVTINHFYTSLAPYGNWVEVDGYGLCWQPTVAVVDTSWRPYLHRGRWLWSDAGWYWYSDYSWGWAPFHYGRWCSYPRLGWVWVPDTTWGPSWVSWRYTSAHCGWAPLPPECRYVSGFGLVYRSSSVSIGFDFGFGHHHYSYVPMNRFCDWYPYRHRVASSVAINLHRESKVVNNIVVNNNRIVNKGIDRDSVARASQRNIPKVAIREAQLASNKTRAERLESDGNSVAVIAPKLPASATETVARNRVAGKPGPALAGRNLRNDRTPASLADGKTDVKTTPAVVPGRAAALAEVPSENRAVTGRKPVFRLGEEQNNKTAAPLKTPASVGPARQPLDKPAKTDDNPAAKPAGELQKTRPTIPPMRVRPGAGADGGATETVTRKNEGQPAVVSQSPAPRRLEKPALVPPVGSGGFTRTPAQVQSGNGAGMNQARLNPEVMGRSRPNNTVVPGTPRIVEIPRSTPSSPRSLNPSPNRVPSQSTMPAPRLQAPSAPVQPIAPPVVRSMPAPAPRAIVPQAPAAVQRHAPPSVAAPPRQTPSHGGGGRNSAPPSQGGSGQRRQDR